MFSTFTILAFENLTEGRIIFGFVCTNIPARFSALVSELNQYLNFHLHKRIFELQRIPKILNMDSWLCIRPPC